MNSPGRSPSPVSLELSLTWRERALECERFATRSYARPILDAGCGDGVFSRMLFNGVILDCAVDSDPEDANYRATLAELSAR